MTPQSFALAGLVVVLIVLAYVVYISAHRKTRAGPNSSLYAQLGGIFPIAAVVNHFSDAVLQSPLVGVGSPNPQLREWSQKQSAARLPGLKFMRTLWVADAAGGPFRFHGGHAMRGHGHLDLEAAHRRLRITPAEFDEVARLLAASLDHFQVPDPMRAAVLSAFLAHKTEVTAGSMSP